MKDSKDKAEKISKNSNNMDKGIFSKLEVLFKKYIEKTSIEIENPEKNHNNHSNTEKNDYKDTKTNKKSNHNPGDSSNKNHHVLPGYDKIVEIEHKILNLFKSGKFTWVNIVILIIGLLLILFGIVFLSGSSEKVADNVVFGERAVLAVFVILIGVILVAISLAYKLLNKTFLNKLFKDLKVVEKKSENADEINSNNSKKNRKQMKEEKNV
ncbi:MAG: hypothetical protein ACP5C3_05500 [Methanomicrobiales archaeon]